VLVWWNAHHGDGDEEGEVMAHDAGTAEGRPIDFESIKQITPYGIEYWSARSLAPLLGYKKWQNFDVAIKRAMTAGPSGRSPII